jgi:exopolysaccharide biosynthesis polyprenyl glycosylphosphotransferase
MIGRRQEINLQLTEILDGMLLALGLWLSHWLRRDVFQLFWPGLEPIPGLEEHSWVFAAVAPFMPILLEQRGFYSNLVHKTLMQSLRQIGESLVLLGTFIGGLVVFLRWAVPSRSVVVLAVILCTLFLLLRQKIQQRRIRQRLSTGHGAEPVILAGAREDLENFEQSLSTDQRAALAILARLDITQQPVDELVQAMHEHSVGKVLFCTRHVHFGKIEEAVQACETEGVEAWIATDFFRTTLARPTFDILGGQLMLVFHTSTRASWSLIFKSLLDRVLALALLLLSTPFWLVAMAGIRLSSRGPVFFKQERAGMHGRPFQMWKFRTMHLNAEARRAELESLNEMDGPVFKIVDDPRIFRFGRWLRRLSIDELPQLLNVLAGEMSLVGPRPLPVYETQRIEKHAQRRRLSVKPGLTCLWQVCGRNGISSFEEWVALDLKYIDNWSLLLDAKILLLTLPAVIRGTGAS